MGNFEGEKGGGTIVDGAGGCKILSELFLKFRTILTDTPQFGPELRWRSAISADETGER
jgi:hypothetical protein